MDWIQVAEGWVHFWDSGANDIESRNPKKTDR
jgi:hypothetical protein